MSTKGADPSSGYRLLYTEKTTHIKRDRCRNRETNNRIDGSNETGVKDSVIQKAHDFLDLSVCLHAGVQ